MAIDTYLGSNYFKMHQQNRWWEYLYLILLLVVALILFTVNLGKLPLDQMQEGITAQIAQDIWQISVDSPQGIFPPFSKLVLFQSPFFPYVVGFVYKVAGFSPLTTRLPSALLGVVSIAILYGIGRELFTPTLPTILACWVYVTLFPVINQSRLGTFDASLLCFEMLTLWGLLRSRRDLRWSLITGLGLCLSGLTYYLSVLALLIIIFLYLFWDIPRLLFSVYFWLGLILGILPLGCWLLIQWNYYAPILSWAAIISRFSVYGAIDAHLGDKWLFYQSFSRYLAFSLNYSSSWFIVALYGLKLAWRNRNWGWAKFVLIISSLSSLWAILAIASNLIFSNIIFPPFSILPFYPVLALTAGVQLAKLRNLPSYLSYPVTWSKVYGVFALLILIWGLYSNLILQIQFDWWLLAIFGSTICTLSVASLLLIRRDIQFLPILIWGNYLSLFLFFSSKYWI